MKTAKPTTFVTVQEAPTEVEAQMIRGRLEVAGFHPVVRNEFSAMTLMGSRSSAMARLLIQVPAAEADEAKQFLASPDTTTE